MRRPHGASRRGSRTAARTTPDSSPTAGPSSATAACRSWISRPPATSPCRTTMATVWIAFNGEIYNFLELRQELAGAGHRFRSRTDTEVILHGYQEWGIEKLLEKLSGMFAFAIYDSAKPQLVLARDRFGIKPLYYTRGAGRSLDGVRVGDQGAGGGRAGAGRGRPPRAGGLSAFRLDSRAAHHSPKRALSARRSLYGARDAGEIASRGATGISRKLRHCARRGARRSDRAQPGRRGGEPPDQRRAAGSVPERRDGFGRHRRDCEPSRRPAEDRHHHLRGGRFQRSGGSARGGARRSAPNTTNCASRRTTSSARCPRSSPPWTSPPTTASTPTSCRKPRARSDSKWCSPAWAATKFSGDIATIRGWKAACRGSSCCSRCPRRCAAACRPLPRFTGGPPARRDGAGSPI